MENGQIVKLNRGIKDRYAKINFIFFYLLLPQLSKIRSILLQRLQNEIVIFSETALLV